MNKTISVIAPSYNHEKFIEKCLNSVFEQSYSEIEVIIIDDCSSDNTAVIIENLIKSRKNVKFIKHQKNKGAHFSINEGLKNATGDYLTVINTDDFYEKDRFSSMIKKMESQNSEIAFSKIVCVDESEKIVKTEETDYFNEIQEKASRQPLVSLTLLEGNCAISTGNLLFTRDIYEKIGGFREYKYIHDWDFILKASLITEPMFCEDTAYFYRLHTTNTYKKLKENENSHYGESLQMLSEHFKKLNARGEVLNQKIPSKETIEYFLEKISENKEIYQIYKEVSL